MPASADFCDVEMRASLPRRYRKDLLDDAGQTMPDNPTWEDVKKIAKEMDVDGDMPPRTAGICLRDMPGWSSMGATFTTMLNT